MITEFGKKQNMPAKRYMKETTIETLKDVKKIQNLEIGEFALVETENISAWKAIFYKEMRSFNESRSEKGDSEQKYSFRQQQKKSREVSTFIYKIWRIL